MDVRPESSYRFLNMRSQHDRWSSYRRPLPERKSVDWSVFVSAPLRTSLRLHSLDTSPRNRPPSSWILAQSYLGCRCEISRTALPKLRIRLLSRHAARARRFLRTRTLRRTDTQDRFSPQRSTSFCYRTRRMKLL